MNAMIEPVKATWYFDIISPYAYLHFKLHDKIAAPLKIEYVPVLFAGLLKAHGMKGPAEITENAATPIACASGLRVNMASRFACRRRIRSTRCMRCGC